MMMKDDERGVYLTQRDFARSKGPKGPKGPQETSSKDPPRHTLSPD
jgi:hypothetical protein